MRIGEEAERQKGRKVGKGKEVQGVDANVFRA